LAEKIYPRLQSFLPTLSANNDTEGEANDGKNIVQYQLKKSVDRDRAEMPTTVSKLKESKSGSLVRVLAPQEGDATKSPEKDSDLGVADSWIPVIPFQLGIGTVQIAGELVCSNIQPTLYRTANLLDGLNGRINDASIGEETFQNDAFKNRIF